MRIAKVALAFFSIGFVAGSFERAAGLGDPQRPQRIKDRQVDAAVARSTLLIVAAIGPMGGNLPEELRAQSLSPSGRLPSVDPLGVLLDLTTVVPLAPDLRRLGLGAKRMLSEPDPQAMSRLPSRQRMSLLPAEPWDLAPEAGLGSSRQPAPIGTTQNFIMPFERGRVTSLFNQGRYHPAIDLAGALGSAVLSTTRRQRVVFAGRRGGYGNAVITRDEFGRQHLYGHLQRIVARVGTLLDQGQVLGRLGSTGHSTGPHVHYEVRNRTGGHINPVTLLFPGRRVGRGFAWNGARSVKPVATTVAQAQPRPR
jgi:Peptidase family M23